MGLNAKGGQITSATSTGNQATTGLGFQPKLLCLYSTLVSGATQCTPNYGFGTSSSARFCLSQFASYTAGAQNAETLFDSTRIFRYAGSAGATFIAADLVSLDADGFTLDWKTVDASGYPINYWAIGGSDLSVKVGTFNTAGSTGNQATTGVGFPPGVMLFCMNELAALDGTINTNRGNMGFGAAKSSSARSAVAAWIKGALTSPTDASGVLATNRCFSFLSPSNTEYNGADFVSLDADGFTINLVTATGGDVFKVGYVALGGTAQFAVGTVAQPGSTGNQATSGLGFQPLTELFWSGGKAASNTPSNESRFMLGHAVSSSDRGALWAAGKDNQSAQALSRAILTTKAIEFRADDAVTVVAEADVVSQDADGFTIDWTTADATARLTGFLAIGAASSAFDPVSLVGSMAPQAFLVRPPREAVGY